MGKRVIGGKWAGEGDEGGRVGSGEGWGFGERTQGIKVLKAKENEEAKRDGAQEGNENEEKMVGE